MGSNYRSHCLRFVRRLTRFGRNYSAISSQSNAPPRSAGDARRGQHRHGNIFSLWLSYNNAARLTSKSYLSAVTLTNEQGTGRPRARRRRHGYASFLINRLPLDRRSSRRDIRDRPGAAQRRTEPTPPRRQRRTCTYGSDGKRGTASFFHIEIAGTARIAQSDFAASHGHPKPTFRPAAQALRRPSLVSLEAMHERRADCICEAC
jgi:hypothetical protein